MTVALLLPQCTLRSLSNTKKESQVSGDGSSPHAEQKWYVERDDCALRKACRRIVTAE